MKVNVVITAVLKKKTPKKMSVKMRRSYITVI